MTTTSPATGSAPSVVFSHGAWGLPSRVNVYPPMVSAPAVERPKRHSARAGSAFMEHDSATEGRTSSGRARGVDGWWAAVIYGTMESEAIRGFRRARA